MSEQTLTPEQQDQERRLKWFREARFGMFIHWGLYAQLGRHEWVMNRERIPVAEYELLAERDVVKAAGEGSLTLCGIQWSLRSRDAAQGPDPRSR